MKNHYKYLNLLTLIYMTVKLITVVVTYKIITLGPYSAAASTLVMPLWFVMGDIIAEVYGYKIARNIIWMVIVCQFFFAFVCTALIQAPSPAGWMHQEAYNQVFNNLPRVALASSVAIVCGALINAYAISKWKILLRGKYFWLRSLGASTVGELVFTIIAFFIGFFGILPISNLMHLLIISYMIKVILNPILIIPCAMLAALLKRIEGVDVYDMNINFSPFNIDLLDNKLKRISSEHIINKTSAENILR